MHFSDQEKIFMKTAMQLAQESYNLGEVPVGAIVIKNNEIIGRGRNTVISDNDVTAHAEINAIREASKMIGNYRLVDCICSLHLSHVICAQKQLLMQD